jgi:hypothetical protein
MSTISGFSHTACSLAKSGFGLPLPGLPADFAIDLLAKLWSSGTLTVCDHPLGNIIEFHGTSSNPNDLGLSWRECISCLMVKSGRTENLLDVLMKGIIFQDFVLIADL